MLSILTLNSKSVPFFSLDLVIEFTFSCTYLTGLYLEASKISTCSSEAAD